MKKSALFATLFLLGALPAAAQTFDFSLLLGRGQTTENGFSFDFNDSVREIEFGGATDVDQQFFVKLGSMDTTNEKAAGGLPATADGKIEYVDALVGYDFSEIFGTTTLFAGPGYYRQKYGDFDETNWGASGGVTGKFPVTRNFAVLAEAAYHYAHFDQSRSFVTVTGGVRFGF